MHFTNFTRMSRQHLKNNFLTTASSNPTLLKMYKLFYNLQVAHFAVHNLLFTVRYPVL